MRLYRVILHGKNSLHFKINFPFKLNTERHQLPRKELMNSSVRSELLIAQKSTFLQEVCS